MAIKFINFDYDESNPTAYEYTAADFRTVYNQLSSNGIMLSPSVDVATDTSLKVVAITGGVRISSGIAAIQGAFAIVTNEDILFSTDGTYKVVLEFNSVLNKIYAKISTDALTRTSTVWQLQLATVVKSGATYTVTDTRRDTSLCGYANRLFDASTIIASGSNANGSYIKFGDGTLKQWFKGSMVVGSASGFTKSFPAPFIDNQYACVVSSLNSKTVITPDNVYAASTNFWCYRTDEVSTVGTTVTFAYQAIGRWK